MRAAAYVAGALLLVCSFANADYYSAKTRGVFPYWQTGSNWLTVMAFVNSSEETGDTVCVMMVDEWGEWPPGCAPPTVNIGPGQMCVFSTSPSVPFWIPVSGGYGYTLFSIEDGSAVAAFSAVVSLSPVGGGYVVPAYRLDEGF